MDAIGRVLDHSRFVLGPEVAEFEQQFAAYCGTRYAVGVDSGTSALYLALKALGIGEGDEVITVPNSFLASASSIALTGARPVFVDVRDDYNLDPYLLEAAITPRTRAVIPVHLTGRPADMFPVLEICESKGLHVVEDCAQAVGARYQGQRIGSFGTVGCFSLHPLKNLNAVGDAGVVVTNNDCIFNYLVKARNHGLRNRDECEFWSHNCRLDTIHAAILLVKLKYLDQWTLERRCIADFYRGHLSDLVQTPHDKPCEFAVYQTFIVQTDRRKDLAQCLRERGIEVLIHNPIPIHLQEAARYLGYKPGDFPVTERQAQRVLSLPIFPNLTREQQDHVVNTIRDFCLGG
jgi:dTDP-4-amino-4,6-dideoxygalactose transaminase